MYSNNLKFSLLKINQIKLVFVQFERFLRCKVLVFHIFTYLWHLWLNCHTFVAVWYLFREHWDIVEKTCGFGSQYITVWNQVALQLYFSTSLAMEIMDLKCSDKLIKFRNILRKILPYSFTSFVFPVSFLVAINFWTYYSIEREIIDEDNVMHLYIPRWINHGLHTTIVLLVCVENVLKKHSYPDGIWGYVGVSSFLISYAATCTILYAWSGFWPYPLIRGMTDMGKIWFVILNCLLGILFVVIGEEVNKKVWGTKITEPESTKKCEKASS